MGGWNRGMRSIVEMLVNVSRSVQLQFSSFLFVFLCEGYSVAPLVESAAKLRLEAVRWKIEIVDCEVDVHKFYR